jgi:predicted RNA-binding protein with TRAM domain
MKIGDLSRLKNAGVTILEGSVKLVIKTRTGDRLAIKIAKVGEDYATVEALDQIVKNDDSREEMGTNEMNECDLKSDSELTRNQKKDCRS